MRAKNHSLRVLSVMGCALLLTLCASCKERKTDNNQEALIEKPRRGPIGEGARTLSERADLVMAFRSVEEVVSTMSTLTPDGEVMEEALPALRQLKESSGLDLLSVESWKKIGVKTDAPFYVLSTYGRSDFTDPVMAFPVTDRDQFELAVTRQFQLTVKEKGSGYTTYNENFQMIDCGPLVLIGEDERGVRELCATQGTLESRSVADTIAFQNFEQSVMGSNETVGVFLQARGPAHREILRDLYRSMGDTPIEATKFARLMLTIQGVGFSVKVEKEQWIGRGWFGLDENGRAMAKELTRATPVIPLSEMVTRDVLGATAFRLDGVNMWELFVSLLTPRGEADIERALGELEQQFGLAIDPRRDIFAGHTGNILIAAYSDEQEDPFDLVKPIAMTTYAKEEDVTRIKGIFQELIAKVGAQLESQQITSGDDKSKTYEQFSIQGFVPVMFCFGNKRIAIAHGELGLDAVNAAMFGVTPGLALPPEKAKLVDGEIGGIVDGATFKRAMVAGNEMEALLAPLFPDNVLVRGKLGLSGLVFTGHATPTPNPDAFKLALERQIKERLLLEGENKLWSIGYNAKMYFTSEQKYGEAWHPPVSGVAEKSMGYPTPWDEYVFPGGKSVTLMSSDKLPEAGTSAPFSPTASAHLEPLLDKLLPEFVGSSSWRFTYKTGPGSGDQATASIIAERDFDPKKPGAHTIEMKIYVDERSQEVIMVPPVTTNEFH